MAITWVIPGRLSRTARPGFSGANPTDVDPGEVEAWLGEARADGIHSILCLLDERQLSYYPRLPGGLLETYRRAGMAVSSVAVADLQTPPIPASVLPRIWQAFRALPPPLLIHCSAGIDRSGAAVAYILDRLSPGPNPEGDFR
jgi:hypothetical protein